MIGPPDPRFQRGLAAYRAGRHFEAHEHWEEMWRETPEGDARQLLQALIQIAAAMYKLVEKRDADSARRLLGRARGRLEKLPAKLCRLDVAALAQEVARVEREIAAHQATGT